MQTRDCQGRQPHAGSKIQSRYAFDLTSVWDVAGWSDEVSEKRAMKKWYWNLRKT